MGGAPGRNARVDDVPGAPYRQWLETAAGGVSLRQRPVASVGGDVETSEV